MRLYGFYHKIECIMNISFEYVKLKYESQDPMRLYGFYHKFQCIMHIPSFMVLGVGCVNHRIVYVKEFLLL